MGTPFVMHHDKSRRLAQNNRHCAMANSVGGFSTWEKEMGQTLIAEANAGWHPAGASIRNFCHGWSSNSMAWMLVNSPKILAHKIILSLHLCSACKTS